MLKKRVLVLICLLLVGCEKDCEKDFMSAYNGLQRSFDQLITNPSEANANALKQGLNTFLGKHDGVKCKDGKTTLDPTAEVKSLLAEMNGARNSSTKAEVVAKLVYGDDNRVDLEDSANSSYRAWGRSTMAQVSRSKIGRDGGIIAQTLKEKHYLCDGERFSDQLTAARCSGFLVGPDIVMTAGHCVEDQDDCDENYWVTDYTKGVTSLNTSQIYQCERIIDQVLDYDTGLDYAVIKLSKTVSDRKYFRWRSDTESLKVGQPLVVIGYPSGLPAKIADRAVVKDNSEDHFFRANLDTFAGNSGSAVINALSGVVEGILVRGETDYKPMTGADGVRCMTVNQCSDSSGCDGGFEEVSRMSSVTGIPFGYSEESLVNGIIGKKVENLTTVYGVKLYGKQFAEYQVVGRSFLNRCGFKFVSDNLTENEITIHSCEDYSSMYNSVATYLNRFYF